ncbi:bromodomain-containing protein, putative [Eimeria tenella]|uniref:Bromodomain-containing protein, putative n=1 Tax=Eimeria tenella TaxID=5802 RepID=U6KWI7_EIMTE|nr:bromodomain-containing protein, putative [Eimeria tenella]CDJ42477.1 bromodomain-containing protein, putative [Eimeria tenella]|eukprot:XP_013233227.1 bromodomain-containing protein, putative [Eimeria tenella]
MPVSGTGFSLGSAPADGGANAGADPQRGAPCGLGVSLARHVKRKLAGLLDGWRRAKSFRLFLEPVDVEQMECPTYYDIIKYPMDLRTMEAKLERDEYRSEEAFISDLLLIFRNCRTFNDGSTPAGQFVLRLCAEAETRSLEDLKKAYKDSKLWAALEQQFSHGKQKAGPRNKSGGSSKRAASGISSVPDVSLPATGVLAAAAAAPNCSGAADFQHQQLSSEGAGGDVAGASPAVPYVGGLAYMRNSTAPQDGTSAAEGTLSKGVEGFCVAPEKASEAPAASVLSGISPSRELLTPAASGAHIGAAHAWPGDVGGLTGQGTIDADNSSTGKSWYIYCRDNILRPLKGDRYAYLFLTPVLDSPELPDAVKTSYKSVIARPMDYGTIWTKLTTRDYRHPVEFFEDMFLVYSNCMAFNPPNDQQCGWLHRVAEKSRDKFMERWRRWVVRIWRAFAQHNAAGAAAAPPVLQHAEAAAAAAAVEAEPSIAAALSAARAELLERRNHQSTALSPPNPQELQHPNLHHPQLQHHKMQHQQRGSDEPHDAAAMAANAATAAKDPKALVVDLLGEDALEDASNSSVDRGATQETLQQQLQQLQQQQQLLQHEHLQLQQQQREMQEKEQTMTRASGAGDGSLHSDGPGSVGLSGSTNLHQQQANDMTGVVPETSVYHAAGDVAFRGELAIQHSHVKQLGGDAGLPTADAAAAATDSKKHKSKKHKHQKYSHRGNPQLQQQQKIAELQHEVSDAYQFPGSAELTAIQSADPPAIQAKLTTVAVVGETAAGASSATTLGGTRGIDASSVALNSAETPPGPSVASAISVNASSLYSEITAQQIAEAAPAGDNAAVSTGDTAGGSLLPVRSLGDSPRLSDIIEAPPAEILEAMGMKDMSAAPPCAAAAAPAPVSAPPAISVAAPLAADDVTHGALPPSAAPAAPVPLGPWLTGMVVPQLPTNSDGATVAAGTIACAGGAAGVSPLLLPPPLEGVVSMHDMQNGAALHHLEQQQQQRTRDDLLPAKLRIVVESTRKKVPPPKLLLLPWRGRGQGPVPQGYTHRPSNSYSGLSSAAVATVPAVSTAAGPTRATDSSAASVKREATQGESASTDTKVVSAGAELSWPAAAIFCDTGSISMKRRPKLTLRLSNCSRTSRKRQALGSNGILAKAFFMEEGGQKPAETLEDASPDSLGKGTATGTAMFVTAGHTGEEETSVCKIAGTQAEATLAVAESAAAAAAAAQDSAACVLQLMCRVGQLPEWLEVHEVLTGLQDCGFARHTLTRCCRNWAAGENRSNNSRTHSYSKTELWLQQQTVRIQPMGPLTEILGDAAGRSCPVSVSVLRFVTLSNSAAAAVIPILLHLRLHEADAAAAVLATKGEYLVAPCIQLAAAAAVAAGGTGDLTTLSPTLGTAASNDSAESNSRCCCSDIDGWQQKRGSLISGRRLFSLERQIIRSLPRRLMEELQQERQKHELQTRLLSGERWRPGLRSSLAHALGTRVVELLLRAAVSADIQANFNHSVSNGTHKSGRNECLSEELKFIEDLNLWVAALPTELLIPLQQQHHQRQRMLRLPAFDVLFLHAEPLGLVTLSRPLATGSCRASRMERDATAASDSVNKVDVGHCHSTDGSHPGLNPSGGIRRLKVQAHQKTACWDLHVDKTCRNHDSDCCWCCCLMKDAAVQRNATPLQVALCLG